MRDQVFCVMESDWEGSFLCSIWSTEELAETEAARLRDCYHHSDFYTEPYFVDPTDLD